MRVLILQSLSKSVEQSANFEKCIFEKITFKIFGGYTDKKNSYFSIAFTNLCEIWLRCLKYTIHHVLILQSSSKSVEQSVIFRSSISGPV